MILLSSLFNSPSCYRFFCSSKKLASGIYALAAIIFSLGIALKNTTVKKHFVLAFKKSSLKTTGMPEDIGNFAINEDKCKLMAKKILSKKGVDSDEQVKEYFEKSAMIATMLCEHREQLLSKENLLKRIPLKIRGEKARLKKTIFKKTVKSMLELKEPTLKQDFVKLKTRSATNQLFGHKLYQVKLTNGSFVRLSRQRLIGSGTYNNAFFSFDLTNKKPRICRLLKKEQMNSDLRWITRLLKENYLHQKLSQDPLLKKRVIKIHAILRSEPYYGSILDFADQGTLRDAIDEERLAPEQKKDILLGISFFLRDLHARYVLGDFKPENILLKTVGQKILVKFSDFAGTHLISENISSIMTPAYMAPEIQGNLKTTVFSDCWALGILLYQMKFQIKAKNQDVPDFVKEALKIINYYADDSFRDHHKMKQVQELFKEKTQEFAETLNHQDPYNGLILDLLKYNPHDRIQAATVVDRLAAIPASSFSQS